MWQWNVLTIYHRRINNRSEKDENMVWTDSQDYGFREDLQDKLKLGTSGVGPLEMCNF